MRMLASLLVLVAYGSAMGQPGIGLAPQMSPSAMDLADRIGKATKDGKKAETLVPLILEGVDLIQNQVMLPEGTGPHELMAELGKDGIKEICRHLGKHPQAFKALELMLFQKDVTQTIDVAAIGAAFGKLPPTQKVDATRLLCLMAQQRFNDVEPLLQKAVAENDPRIALEMANLLSVRLVGNEEEKLAATLKKAAADKKLSLHYQTQALQGLLKISGKDGYGQLDQWLDTDKRHIAAQLFCDHLMQWEMSKQALPAPGMMPYFVDEKLHGSFVQTWAKRFVTENDIPAKTALATMLLAAKDEKSVPRALETLFALPRLQARSNHSVAVMPLNGIPVGVGVGMPFFGHQPEFSFPEFPIDANSEATKTYLREKALTHKDFQVRQTAMRIVSRHTWPEFLDQLEKMASTAQTLEESMEAIAIQTNMVRAMEWGLQHPEPDGQKKAADAYKKYQVGERKMRLQKQLSDLTKDDNDPLIQEESIAALSQLNPRVAIQILQNLHDREKSPGRRERLLQRKQGLEELIALEN